MEAWDWVPVPATLLGPAQVHPKKSNTISKMETHAPFLWGRFLSIQAVSFLQF